eukprot:1553199-Pleurochrysis_carterae.AAC.1
MQAYNKICKETVCHACWGSGMHLQKARPRQNSAVSAEFVAVRRAADREERPSGRARPRRTACSVGVRAQISPEYS